MNIKTVTYNVICPTCDRVFSLLGPEPLSFAEPPDKLLCPECSHASTAEEQHARFVARNASMHERIVHLEKMAENADDDIQELERRCKNLHQTNTLQQGKINDLREGLDHFAEQLKRILDHHHMT